MNPNRRQFLRLLGSGVVASAGLTQTVTAQESPVVKMGNNYFDPVGLHVESGTTVRFEIEAGVHSATVYQDRLPEGAPAFDSGVISQGSFEQTFDAPGTYDYYCIPHRSVGMVGRIVVGEPGGPAEQSPIPDGNVPDSEIIVEQGAIAYGATSDDDRNTGGGMMGPGMMNGQNWGWFGGLPVIGGALGMLGIGGGALYWALRRENAHPEREDTAMAVLRNQYARGNIDEDEFNRRRERLENHDEG